MNVRACYLLLVGKKKKKKNIYIYIYIYIYNSNHFLVRGDDRAAENVNALNCKKEFRHY